MFRASTRLSGTASTSRNKTALVRGTAAEGPTKALSNAHHCVESLRALSAMTTGAMPQHHATGHVLYMLSGVDIATAAAIYPHAQSYTLVAEMPAWGCVRQNTTPALCQEPSKHVKRGAVHAYFSHWASPSGSGCNGATATGTMLPLFADVGVAATLAAGLRVAGHNVVRMTPSTLGTRNQNNIQMLTILTDRARVFYLQANLRQPRARHLVEAHVRGLGSPRLALVKGAGDVTTHGSPLGKLLLGLSDVVVHGKTGPLDQMQPTCNFDQRQPCPDCWSIDTFGNFESLRGLDEKRMMHLDAWRCGLGPGADDGCLSARAWAAAFAGKEKEKELPVRFDYGGNWTNGVMIVAVKRRASGTSISCDTA